MRWAQRRVLLPLCSQNFFLNVYGLMFNVVALLATCAFTGRTLRAAFAGQSAVTALLIANNAAQVSPLRRGACVAGRSTVHVRAGWRAAGT